MAPVSRDYMFSNESVSESPCQDSYPNVVSAHSHQPQLLPLDFLLLILFILVAHSIIASFIHYAHTTFIYRYLDR